jgi:hypothetical protein
MTNDILKIPQYINTAWLNAIIMAILYSKYSRELLLKSKLLSNRKEPFAQLLNKLLKKDKDLKIDLNNFNLLKPTEILFKSLGLNESLIPYIYKYSWYSWLFIIHFFRYIKTSYLALDYYNNNLYFGVRTNLNLNNENNKIVYNMYEKVNNKYADKAFNLLIKENPHPNYITVNVWNSETHNAAYIQFLNLILFKDNVGEKLNLDSYKSIKYEGIKELKDEIVYNNYKYKLDSILLDDYKAMSDNSDITTDNRYGMVGIINDKNVKYAYNAQSRIIDKSEYNLIYLNANKILPCEYMEYDWDQKNYKKKLTLSKSFCEKDIKTMSKEEYNLYYFGRGIRTLIYVKQERKLKSSNSEKKAMKNAQKQRNEVKMIINSYKKQIQEYKEIIKEIKDKINIQKKELEKLIKKKK